MPTSTNLFTTIRTEGVLLPPDLLQRIVENDTSLDGLTAESYHRSGQKLKEVINQSWNNLQGIWTNFKTARDNPSSSAAATTITRERWLLPLFRELDYGRLGTSAASDFTIEGKNYPISHKSIDGIPIHLVSHDIDLDKRTPGVAGASTASPHSLLQVFLNRSDAHLWGFLSNGHKLRILRDNVSLTRQAYVEFDLQAMMDGEVYSDFVLVWLICHQSRVENGRDCWLEKWAQTAQQQGTRALDQLRDGVKEAIEKLGIGFLDHPENTALRDSLHRGDLASQDYYRQLLRLVYRLLVIFTAEDRELLYDPTASDGSRQRYTDHYSTRRLRRIAEKLKGTRHADLYEALRVVMRLLGGEAQGAAALGLPVLDSFLFRDESLPDLINAKIANLYFLDAIRALAFVEDHATRSLRPIDYRNLGPEELGSVYESLLELHPKINIAAKSFELATAGGNERKTTGSYYTPTSLINALLDSALDPVLKEAAKKGEAAILALKICDPACGSGHFLIAAAHRVARELARVQTGEEAPSPTAHRAALRDVIGHCIYGVDINPMAVELCKVNLWMEALEPGKPLSFLDHRIQCGNSLLGTTPALMAQGIPDDAFTPIEGDDKTVVNALRKQNKQEHAGQKGLFDQLDAEISMDYRALQDAMRSIDRAPDETLAQIRVKEDLYRQFANDPERIKARRLADAWCAAFVWVKKPQTADDAPPMTQRVYKMLERDQPFTRRDAVEAEVLNLAARYQFFHWHIAFPDVFTVDTRQLIDSSPRPEGEGAGGEGLTGWIGGFDCVLGNPPWERIKIQEKEWFAERAPEIANAPNAAARRKAIAELAERDPYLLQAFADDKRKAEGESHFVRVSNRYPLCGRGDVNTYTIFAETSRQVINAHGRVGIIVPSGIATDDTTKFFFQDLIKSHSLASFYDFENSVGLFPGIGHGRFKFCLLTITGLEKTVPRTEFVFFAHYADDIKDRTKIFSLSAEEIAQINPNTGTMATFRSQREADITKAVYKEIPVLINEKADQVSHWGIGFSTMFHMSNDSHLFRANTQLEDEGFRLDGNHYVRGQETYLPLYEAKMIHHFTHRNGDYRDYPEDALGSHLPDISSERLVDPNYQVFPRYWILKSEVESRTKGWNHDWFIAFRDVTNATNERTAISSVLPRIALGHKAPLILFGDTINIQLVPDFLANIDSFIFDYIVRQKMGGTSLGYFIFKQLPVIPPHTYTQPLLDFILPRVLELTYTAWDLQPFAQDVGCDGPPFIWDDERRFLMRCELDALYFHLYQINRDDVDYIMETFPIVKRKDIAATSGSPRPEGYQQSEPANVADVGLGVRFSSPLPLGEGQGGEGSYRTKDTILAMYDQMAALPTMPVPAPKDASATYTVPDVGQWSTWLNPPPADPSVAHKE